MVYVPFGGHFGDCGHYHGFIFGISIKDPGAVESWATRARGGGIWATGGISTDGKSLFFATGNTFDSKEWGDGEAVFRLAPDLHRSETSQDFFAAANWRELDWKDADLGGTNPVLLDVPGLDGAQALVLALGKDGRAYLLNRYDLGASAAPLRSRLSPRVQSTRPQRPILRTMALSSPFRDEAHIVQIRGRTFGTGLDRTPTS
jgi:hypothetical protein